MGNSLLSIDWDYFISTENQGIISNIENERTIVDEWYKKYFQLKSQGKNIQNLFKLSSEVDSFWDRIKQIFIFNKKTKVYVSDSHVLSYDIAKKFQCTDVYLFDAHSDLGYGGTISLEVNCANWLGFLLKEQVVKNANIIYSPFTKEKPEFFKHLNQVFDIKYLEIQDLHTKVNTSLIHICRSGAWTPPWFDQNFVRFLNASGLKYQVVNCPVRQWEPKNLNFADQIQYLLA
ncbi:arginase [Lysinibacillus sp. PLM2]|nr:arginase [Lysinibacillus sp. PLM2]